MSRIAYVEGLLTGESQFPPSGRLLGLKLVSFEPGQATLEFRPQPEFLNFAGTVQGGFLTAFADSAMGSALATVCSEEETWATLELKVNFLRPAIQDGNTISCTAKVTHKGKTIAFIEAELFDASSNMVAKVTASFAIKRQA